MTSSIRRFGAWATISLLLLGNGAAAQGLLDPADQQALGGVLGMAPPPPPPRPIRGFMIHYANSEADPERSIALRWTGANAVADYRVFRQRLQMTQQVDTTGFMALMLPSSDLNAAPGDWTEIATLDPTRRSFRDIDVPPINLSLPPVERRSLGEVYCYRVETKIGVREELLGVRQAISPVVCTRLRGINAPTVRLVSSNPGEITVSWDNNSQMRVEGYEVQYWEENGGAVQSVILVGDGGNRHTFGGLKPDDRYCAGVKTMEFHGRSQLSRIHCVKTQPLPEPEPESDERTFTVHLNRELIVSGYIPYVGRFPTAGVLPSGTLTKVEGINGWPEILFVRPGHSTAECDDEDALVLLLPGQTLSEEAMTDAFGSAAPDLPIVFVACIGYSPTLLDWVPLKITYLRD